MVKTVQYFFASSDFWVMSLGHGSRRTERTFQRGHNQVLDFSALIFFTPAKPDLDDSENYWVSIIYQITYVNSMVKQKITSVKYCGS